MRDIPFHRPCIEQAEFDQVADTLKNGWLTMGPKTIQFEEAFRKKVKAKHAVSMNSCTAALHLALRVIDLGEHDEVIIPTMTFAASGEVVRYFNARPVMVDVDRDTHIMQIDDIVRNITPRTRAIMPVHFGGQPADMDEIMAVARKCNLRVIEDAAHCLPSFYRGKPVGSLGDITAFSFYATKTLATGEGGMATTADEECAERLRILRLHGISKDAWKRYSKQGNWYYEVTEIGYKYNMTDVQAALGLAQLAKLEAMWEKRKAVADRYTRAFSQSDLLMPPVIHGYAQTSWHLYVVKLHVEKLSISRSQIMQKLKDRGIGTSVHFIPLHRHPVYKHAPECSPARFKNAEWLYERIISLPIYPGMSPADTDYVIENMLDLLKRHQRAQKKFVHIPLSRPDITDRERRAVKEVLDSPTLSIGPKIQEFEKTMAAYAGRKYAVAVNSGTSALHLIVRAMGIADGDEVITTPFSFIASANCLLFERATPVFVDIDPHTLNLDVGLVRKCLQKRKRVKAILAVDIFGHPAEWDELYSLAREFGVKLIEDSSEALGARYRSPAGLPRRRWRTYRKAGSFGDASVFAFYPNKQITTGEGGIVLTDDRKLYALCQSMRNQGRAAAKDWFDHVRLGYNYRISDINCALGAAQMERLDDILAKRKAVAEGYNRLLGPLSFLETPYAAPHVEIGWFVYVVRLKPGAMACTRDAIMQRLRERGIECSNYFAPIHLQPFYREQFGYAAGDFPVTEDVAARTLALPFHNNLSEGEIRHIAGTLAILAG